MRRPLPLVVVLGAVVALWALAPGAAQEANPFAELSVTAHGSQRLDLATGYTELVDGGTVVDRGSGVELEAPWLRYREGERLEARDALARGPFGQVAAPHLTLDLVAQVLHAEGGVTIETEQGAVEADAVRFEAGAGWLLVSGGVRSERPALEAEAVWYETDGGRLLVLPPYRYDDGPLTLRADADGAPLQLTPAFEADGSLAGYDASTRLDDDVEARLLGMGGG